jgi:hypothetical protein
MTTPVSPRITDTGDTQQQAQNGQFDRFHRTHPSTKHLQPDIRDGKKPSGVCLRVFCRENRLLT